MKIVHICRKFLEGFAYQDNELSDMHSMLGHDVVVITSNSDNSSLYFDLSLTQNSQQHTRCTTLGCRIIRLLPQYNVNYRLWRFKGLYEVLCKEKPDLVFFHGTPFLSLMDVAKYKKNHPLVKLFVDYHFDYYNSAKGFISKWILHKGLYRLITQLCKKHVDTYYYITPDTGKFIHRMYNIPVSKMKFLPLGGNLNKIQLNKRDSIRSTIRKQWNVTEDSLVIISGGKLDYAKNVHNLIKSISKIKDYRIDLFLFGIIDENYKPILLEAIGDSKNVHLIGWIQSVEVYDYYLAADIACFPGSQSVLWQQAICCGLPLVCKYWEGGEYLNVNNNTVFIHGSSAEDIEKSLLPLLNNRDLLTRMKNGAETEGRIFFSYERIAQSIVEDALFK